MANPTASIVTFSILSPDASLSYDRIKLRLEEYRSLLASDSDMIELSTEHGKTLICRNQAGEMEEYLDQAEILLRDVVQSRDISTIVVLHHLRDLAEVLDSLKLYDECHLTGNCALDLAEALGRRSLEFRNEQAETLALIARLSVYQPRARTLFIQAVSICEEVVGNLASHSNKYRLLLVLERAGYWVPGDLCAQWLERAIQLMTKELPPTMVQPEFRCIIYYNYGKSLSDLKQHSNALGAYHEAISIGRTLVNDNPAESNLYLVHALVNTSATLTRLVKYDDAIIPCKEALDICTTMSAHDPLQYNKLMARILNKYGVILAKSNQDSEAAAVGKQAISLFRNLAETGDETGDECTRWLCNTLYNYGRSCHSLGEYAEAVLAYQESILQRRAFTATSPEEERNLIRSLHNISNSFLALGKHDEAHAAATEALERNHGRAIRNCGYALKFKSCFACQKAVITDSPGDDSPPLPLFLADSSPRSAEVPGAEASLPHFQPPTDPSTLTSNPTGRTVKISVQRKRDKFLGWFRGNRGR